MDAILDTSTTLALFNGPQEFTEEDFIAEIRTKLQNILRREFPNSPQKQQLKTDPGGFVFACPYCGDSATQQYKKRGHLTLPIREESFDSSSNKFNYTYKCFNCSNFTSIEKFFHDFNETLSIQALRFIQTNKKPFKSFTAASTQMTTDVFQKQRIMEYAIRREDFRKMLNLSEIDTSYHNIHAYNYLVGRMQLDFRHFMYDPKTNYIIILNNVDDHIIAFQMRALSKNVPKDKRFLTFNLDRIYKKILRRDDVQIPDDLNTLSMMFNIYNVNMRKPVILTEGPMDSYLVPNCVCTTGANKKLPVALPFWYLYDSDKTGKAHAMKMLAEKKKVFLWGRLKRDLGLPERKKWDVNDVVIWCRDNKPAGFTVNWYDYFSDNPIDMINIDSFRLRL